MKKIILICFLILLPVFAWAGSQQTSSTAASTIITNARSMINQDAVSGVTPLCTDAMMLVWVNDGTMDIASRTKCLEDMETVSLISGTTEYALSNAYIEIKDVIYVNESVKRQGLIRGNPTHVGHQKPGAYPKYYYESDGKIGAYPVLATVSGVTPEVLHVYLVERPSGVTSAETVLVPAYYDKALTFYVAAQASLRDGQTAKYGTLMVIYEKELDRYRIDYSEKPKEGDEVVR